MHFHALKRNPKAVHAWEICTHKAIMVDMDASTRDVAALIVQNHIHHVVITDAGTIKGIVSSLDFVRQFLMEAE
ncbi:MAG: CBS domain-containing protein [Sideroxyarcus sp.]|nr:CBS domain-containing protein [Sideroxyarcus sp.]